MILPWVTFVYSQNSEAVSLQRHPRFLSLRWCISETNWNLTCLNQQCMKLQQGATPPLLKYLFKPLQSGHGHEPQGGLRFCLYHPGCVKRLKCLKLTHRGPAYNCKHILPLSKLVERDEDHKNHWFLTQSRDRHCQSIVNRMCQTRDRE